MRFHAILLMLGGIVCAGACSNAQRRAEGPAPRTPAPNSLAHSLSGLSAQTVALLPEYGIRVMPGLDWAGAIGNLTNVQRTFDADVIAALADRGVGHTWIFPEQLDQSFRRNAAYATDPYGLAEEPLRDPALAVGSRLPEPLATQLRTLVALHEGARLILAPVDLRFERAPAGGYAVLRLFLIDPRYSTISWTGELSSDTLPEFSPAISAGLASKLADIVAAP